MDIVICVASKDVWIIRKTVRECRDKFIDTDTIYLVMNKRLFRFFRKGWCVNNNVTLLDEDSLVGGLTFKNVKTAIFNHFTCDTQPGWYFQQLLKMGFALSEYARNNYLIWDSDTIPLKSILFVSKDCKYLINTKEEYHTPYFDTIKRLLGIDKLIQGSFITEHMPIDVICMRSLINDIEKNQNILGDYWFEKIINATSGKDRYEFSEFETYGNYCITNYPDIFEYRNLRTIREAGMLYGRGVSKSELAQLSKMGFDTATFEQYHIPRFPWSIYNWVERQFLKLI